MADLVVGVDGGNSKTDVVLADTEGRVLARTRGPGTRSHVHGIAATVDMMAGLLERARERAGVGGAALSAGAFYLANLDVEASEVAAHREVTARGLAKHVIVGNDTLAALRAGAPDGWGVAVISGAGINAVGVDPDGRTERFLALGDVTGDWGGGASVAMSGLGAAVRAGDGRGGPTALRELLPPRLGVGSVEELAIAVSSGQISYDDVTQLAPVVFEAAETGDAVAIAIMHRLADEVVTLVRALVARLGMQALDVPTVLAGGTLQHGPEVLLHRIRRDLARQVPGVQPVVLDVPPVAGAVLAALAACDATPQAHARLRRALASDFGAPA